MRTLNEKIQALTEGTKYDMPLIGSRGKLYRVTDKAIQINCINVGGTIWIPKSQIVSIDEVTTEIILSSWLEGKINSKSRTSGGAY
tara:strand:- start:1077 stop:1334 length:258 start_codon:yes stop_codon:yes gene_type:complete